MSSRFWSYFFAFLIPLAFLFALGPFSSLQAQKTLNPLGLRKTLNLWREFFKISPEGRESLPAMKAGFQSLIETPPFRVPILLHHYVEDVTDENDFLRRSMAVRPEIFEKQIKKLKETGYSFLSLTGLYQAGDRSERLPEKSVILAFDDGYHDFYTNAWPILKKYQAKATIFVVSNFIGKDGNYMDESQIREVLASGLVELGSHGLSHRDLTGLSAEEAEKEIKESRLLLSARFEVPVYHFAFPGGFASGLLAEAVKAAGYQTAVGVEKGIATEKSNLFHLPRLRVGNLSPEELLKLLK